MSRFDVEAATDTRSAILVEKRPQIARSVAMLSGAAAGDLLLELGAGTGQLGVCFPALGLRYAGLDASARMLAVFAQRLAADASRVRLIHANADADWDVETASVRTRVQARVPPTCSRLSTSSPRRCGWHCRAGRSCWAAYNARSAAFAASCACRCGDC